MGPTAQFARNVLTLEYEDIPPGVVLTTKKIILDSLGVSIAGGSAPGAREVIAYVRDVQGRPESTVIASGLRASAVEAALANGAMVRALDYNETDNDGRTHPSISVVPAAFAMAEKVGGIPGREFIGALTAAIDMHCRISRAAVIDNPGKWLFPQLHGYLSAAAVAGRLARLDEPALINAFGLAYSQTAGSRQATTERAMSRGLQGAFSASAGVMAALLAKHGVGAPRESLEGEQGLFNAYHDGLRRDDALLSGLGSTFPWSDGMSYKPYPSCKQTHPYIDAALRLAKEHALRPQDIEEVTVFTGKWSETLCHPLDVCRRPQSITQAQYSIPFTVAVALVKGKVALDDFLGDGLSDPRVHALARKITPQFDPDLVRIGVEAGKVAVKAKGAVHLARVDEPKGDPARPFTIEEHAAKFRDCASWAARPLPPGKVEAAIDRLLNLESVADVSEVLVLLA